MNVFIQFPFQRYSTIRENDRVPTVALETRIYNGLRLEYFRYMTYLHAFIVRHMKRKELVGLKRRKERKIQ